MKTLVFITNDYPFGTMESFIENEIPYLDKTFDRILFLPTGVKPSASPRSIGKNGKILALPAFRGVRDGFALLRELILLVFSADFYREIADTKRLSGSLKHVFSWFPRWVVYLVRTRHLTDELKKELTADDSVYVYSYWFSFHALIGADVLKKDFRVRRRISRAHRFDIYVRDGKYPPLHRYLLRRLDAVLPCSRQGENYIREQYPEYAGKINASLLGTRDYGEQPYAPASVFRLVSCSNLRQIKRVDRIIDALAQLDIPMEWSHYGDGPLAEELQKMAEEKLAGKPVKVIWRGRLSNSALMREYGENTFDLFANVSDSEGLPVSIMEAMSFGIPCLATDVGGTNEIVLKTTGRLVEPEDAVQKLVDVIKELHAMPAEKIMTLRTQTREFWKKNFSASGNYESFLSHFLLQTSENERQTVSEKTVQ